jgi:hypothetical protein
MTAERREEGALSPDAKREIELMIKIDRLFGELGKLDEEGHENEEARQEIAGKIRTFLNEYQKFFGREAEAKEMIDSYRERLDCALKETKKKAA